MVGREQGGGREGRCGLGPLKGGTSVIPRIEQGMAVMVRNGGTWISHCTEENGMVFLHLFQPTLRNVSPMSFVIGTTPFQMVELQIKGS